MTPTRRAFLGATAAAGLAATAAADETPKKGTRTKLAVNVEMWWGRLPFVERLEAAAKLGFSAVEFWPWRGKNIDAVGETCQRLKLTISQFSAWGFTPGLNNPANHAKFVDEVGASCEVAKKLGVKLMCVVGGNDIKGMSQQQMHENIIEGLKKGAPVAEQADVTLILEPMNIRVDHKGHCLYGSEAGVRLVKAVGSTHVKVLFDLYHNHITEGDLCGHIRDGYAQLGYVQIADHPGRNEPGTGEIHYPRVLKELWTLGYRGYVGLELRPRKSEAEAAAACFKADEW
jgi:hydroxypyruvate isomerase